MPSQLPPLNAPVIPPSPGHTTSNSHDIASLSTPDASPASQLISDLESPSTPLMVHESSSSSPVSTTGSLPTVVVPTDSSSVTPLPGMRT